MLKVFDGVDFDSFDDFVDFDNFDGFDKFDDSDVIDNVCQRDLLDFRRYLSTPVLKKLKKNYFVDHLRNGTCGVLVVVQFEK